MHPAPGIPGASNPFRCLDVACLSQQSHETNGVLRNEIDGAQAFALGDHSRRLQK